MCIQQMSKPCETACKNLDIFQKMKNTEKCPDINNNDSNNPLTSRRTDGGKSKQICLQFGMRQTDQIRQVSVLEKMLKPLSILEGSRKRRQIFLVFPKSRKSMYYLRLVYSTCMYVNTQASTEATCVWTDGRELVADLCPFRTLRMKRSSLTKSIECLKARRVDNILSILVTTYNLVSEVPRLLHACYHFPRMLKAT